MCFKEESSRASTFSGEASPLAVMLHLKTFTAVFGFALEIIFLSAVWAILYRRLAKASKENRIKVYRTGQYL
jgi:hypothetical protein